MLPDLLNEDGMPVDDNGWPIEFLKELMDALRTIPGSEKFDDYIMLMMANVINNASDDGRWEQLPRNRAATQKTSEEEIMRLHNLLDKLGDYIKRLRKPAVLALEGEGFDVFLLLERVRYAQEFTKVAYGCVDAPDKQIGRPKKAEAARVTETSADIYQNFSGVPPTYTSDFETSDVSGPWPDFLQLVFDALRIPDSVSSQVRIFKQKAPRSKSP